MSEQAERISRQWLEQWVIGLNLCPFARFPYEQGRVRLSVTKADNDDDIFRHVLEQMDELLQAQQDELETTVVVIESALKNFDDYLQMLDILEAVLPQTGLEGILQIASFHPDYCFDGVDADDVSNYTNRSPYPMFHLIREASLEEALQYVENPADIPQRNIELMQQMGLEEVRQRLLAISGAGS